MLLYSAHLHYWNLAGPAPRLPSLTILSSLIPTGPSRPLPRHLGLQFHGQTHLVATLVEVLAINEGGEGESDAIPHLLLVAQTHLSRVINLGPQSCVLIQGILATNRETCGVRASRPGRSTAPSSSGFTLWKREPPNSAPSLA